MSLIIFKFNFKFLSTNNIIHATFFKVHEIHVGQDIEGNL